MHKQIQVVVDADGSPRARSVAHELALPIRTTADPECAYALAERESRLVLLHAADAFRGALFVDFGARELAARLRDARSQPLARALGPACDPVVDASAGLGTDAATLAALGLRVILVERHAVLHALLRDGLRRAHEAPATRELAQRMTLVHADAAQWLQSLPPAERPPAIYLDPMYPERKKSALSKRGMQVLQDLLADEGDDGTLLCEVALATATRRVVVKRPLRAPPLVEGVHHTVATKLVRFDVYETKT